jgi:hypothetical protein
MLAQEWASEFAPRTVKRSPDTAVDVSAGQSGGIRGG